MSWTDPRRGNALLVLDRDNDGLIGDGRELFGDATWQPGSAEPNGFRALAMFDTNDDGRIDAQDLVYPYLRLWVDSSHDGVSQHHELFALGDYGITAIHLDYTIVNRRDRFGQHLRYMGFVEVAGRGQRPIYDVFFAVRAE